MKTRFGWVTVVVVAAIATTVMAAALDFVELHEPLHVVRLVTFLLLGVSIGLLSEGLQRSRRRTAAIQAALASSHEQKRELEASLRQAQKLEALGMLAGGVAHDFNNLLAVVSASNSLIGESLPLDATGDDARELVGDVAHAVDRGTALTRQLLAFSRKQVVAPVALDLNVAIVDVRRLITRLVGSKIDVVVAPGEALPCVSIDPGALSQVLINLAVNARDAMPSGGRITIATSHVDGRVSISVGDTGTGMPDEVVARAFEPFYTTKARDRGTGLGLSVVHGVVQQAGGQITIDSTVGVGTCVRIELPALPMGTVPQNRPAESVEDLPRGTERILIVDDEERIRRTTARSLRRLGYDVVEAADGAEALDHLRVTARPFDLILSDVVMPNVDGRELVERVRCDYPSVAVLLMSGHTDDEILRRGITLGDVSLLQKPFRIPTLAQRIRSVLGTTSSKIAKRSTKLSRSLVGLVVN